MISNIQRNIIIRALRIRKEQGENPEDILDKYMNLTSTDKALRLPAAQRRGFFPV